MHKEVRHLALRTVARVAAILGGVNGAILSLPLIAAWLTGARWELETTWIELTPTFVIGGVLASIIGTAFVTMIFAVVFAFAYNVTAEGIGGVVVRLEDPRMGDR